MLGDVTKAQDYGAWIGRSETRDDLLTQGIVDRFNATLDRDDPAAMPGEAALPLIHWLLFLPHERQSGLGPDGHAARGGFLPPVHHLPRRMWAGGRFRFAAPIRVGMAVRRTSTIADVKTRTGATGELVFVTVRHDLTEANGAPLLTEEHDIVYRSATTVAVKPPSESPAQGAWHRSLVPDATLLFRYSALTFNGHRIHYDRSYVTQEEGYPGLIVHGPLVATLLLDLVRRNSPSAALRSFTFRALSPVFDGDRLNLNGTPPDTEGRIALWATNADGGRTMRAEAVVA
jgi:3-methylfumaryl-CoA hydratase